MRKIGTIKAKKNRNLTSKIGTVDTYTSATKLAENWLSQQNVHYQHSVMTTSKWTHATIQALRALRPRSQPEEPTVSTTPPQLFTRHLIITSLRDFGAIQKLALES